MRRLERRIVIGGATGRVGGHLIRHFAENGYTVSALSLKDKPVDGAVETLKWDGETVGAWADALNGTIAVINLSGSPIERLWTPQYRREILSSRVNSSQAIKEALDETSNPPRIWINASASGFYGDTGEHVVDESSPAGTGFLPEVCQAWEAASPGAVHARFGAVLMKDAGFLGTIVPLVEKFLGGAVGSGKQWVSWIHIEDLCRAMLFTIENEIEGNLNYGSPRPIQNEELMYLLRKQFDKPWSPPVPKPVVEMGAKLRGMQPDVALISTRMIPTRLAEAGFDFRFPLFESAIRDLYA